MSGAKDGAAAPREIELKLFVPASALAALRTHPLIASHASGPLRVARLDNRYFDTADRALAANRMALRLRRSGSRWVQTLKASRDGNGALSTRDEWEMPVAGPRLEVRRLADTPLAELGSARALTAKLAMRFTTNFRRESRLLCFPDGTVLEFALDVGTIATGRGKARRTMPISEAELEIVSGEPATLLRFARRLARDVPLIPLPSSKAARGDALASNALAEPAKVILPAPHRDEEAPPYLGRVIAACQNALLLNIHAYCDATSGEGLAAVDGEFVHQARVAVRRLRSALHTFRPLIGALRATTLNDALREVGAMLGEARDWDVFHAEALARIEAVVAIDAVGNAAMAVLREEAMRRRDAAHAALRSFTHSTAFGRTALAVECFIVRGASQRARGSGHALCSVAPHWLAAQQRRVVQRARRIAVLDADGRHRLRIEVKRLRYAIDLFGELYDTAHVKPYRQALAALQDELGALNDTTVALRLLEALDPAEGIMLARERFGAWLARRINKRLPKVAALSVAFELTQKPWDCEESRDADADAAADAGGPFTQPADVFRESKGHT